MRALWLSLSLSLSGGLTSLLSPYAHARVSLYYTVITYIMTHFQKSLDTAAGVCTRAPPPVGTRARCMCARVPRVTVTRCFALCNGPSFHHQIIKQNFTLKHQSTVSVIHRMEDIFANTLPPIVINRHSQRREPDKTPANLRVQQYF